MFADASGRITRFSRESADLEKAEHLPNRAILPGLVNVHSHAFQRVIRGRTEHRSGAERDTFWTWRVAMYHAANQLSPEAVYHSARMAYLEMLLSGITTVGEFHYLHHAQGGLPYDDRNLLAWQMLQAAGETGLRIGLLRAAYVRAGWHKPPDPGQARFLTPKVADFISDTDAVRDALPKISKPGKAWVGVAPHSVRAVPLDYLLEVVRYARANHLPVHMHVSEQPAEVEAALGEYGKRPVDLLQANGVIDSHFTGIHAIHITDQEAAALGDAKARVCACPTSERNLGDGAVPADRLFNAGAGICFGSDSNVQIDLLEDARLLEYHLRMNKLERVVLPPGSDHDALARRLFESSTKTGAQSLRAPAGILEAGREADFFTVDLNDPSVAGAGDALLNHLVFSLERTAIKEVVVGGEFVIREGRHPLQDEIIREFANVQREVWGES